MTIVDKIKVASRDLTNTPLIEAIANRKEDVILSIGMADKNDLETALNIFRSKNKSNISILHCLSQYPAEYTNLNLNTIKFLLEKYPEYQIGYSDHSLGTHIPVAATALGASIIEKHVTLDTNMKGSDHIGSADMVTFHQMVHDIRALEFSLGEKDLQRQEAVNTTREKLERSLAFNKELKPGDIIKEGDLCMLSPGGGYKWEEKNKIIVKLKNFNFLDLNTNEVNAILYDENFSTLRTTNVENNKNNLLFTLVSEEELFLKNEKAKKRSI